MTRDPKQTQTMEEPRAQREGPSVSELAMRTTLVQPIPLTRHPDFVRTRYWEKLSGRDEEPKRSAASYASAGKTVVGLGPDDPIVKAVQAAKAQLLQAERARVQQERTSHERVAEVKSASSASTAMTVLLPGLDSLQLMASHVKPSAMAQVEDAVHLPKRKLKPFLIAAAALAVLACAATVGRRMPESPPLGQTEQSIVKPRAQPAPESAAHPQQNGPVAPAPDLAAASVSAPAQAVQVSEKAAVDALFAGDYGLAGHHYAALANAHPEQPAFAEAARILSRNVRPGTP